MKFLSTQLRMCAWFANNFLGDFVKEALVVWCHFVLRNLHWEATSSHDRYQSSLWRLSAVLIAFWPWTTKPQNCVAITKVIHSETEGKSAAVQCLRQRDVSTGFMILVQCCLLTDCCTNCQTSCCSSPTNFLYLHHVSETNNKTKTAWNASLTKP
jgi:hypothetical protein